MAILFVAAEAAELKPFEAHLINARKLKWPLDYGYEDILEGRGILLAPNGAGGFCLPQTARGLNSLVRQSRWPAERSGPRSCHHQNSKPSLALDFVARS